ncbi:MAG: hypothetical protein M3O70_25880 [Actinomycetota bacterium]|nr:hypothetical protein [Actinomycetota bacterium]
MLNHEVTRLVNLRLGDGATMYVQATSLTPGEDLAEEEREIAARPPSVDQITNTLRAFAAAITGELKATGATRFAVEFGCDLAIETGSLIAILGKGSATTSLKVMLEWTGD